jgi:hypothetical protein
MTLGHLACAMGRHRVDPNAVRRVHGGNVSRCRRCASALEEIMPGEWAVQLVRDAGLGERIVR